jgi:hypothetical protein
MLEINQLLKVLKVGHLLHVRCIPL